MYFVRVGRHEFSASTLQNAIKIGRKRSIVVDLSKCLYAYSITDERGVVVVSHNSWSYPRERRFMDTWRYMQDKGCYTENYIRDICIHQFGDHVAGR